MRKKAAAALITLSMLIATYGILLTYFSLHKKQAPIAVSGAVDLTSWEFAEDGVIPLDGEWELYSDKLLTHRDVSADADEELKPVIIRVPGSWSKLMPVNGAATYRLRIKIDDADAAAVYGLKTASIPISNRLIVNGREAGSSGSPAEKQHYTALNKPYVSYFMLQPGWNEILLQVANYEFRASSGIIESIILGQAGQIVMLRDRATAHDWITLTAFLIMGLYFIGLYSQRRNDRSLVVFGMVCVCIALFTSVSGERVLFEVVGQLPFWLYFRIQAVSAVGVGFGFFLYVHTAFRPYCFKWLVRGSLIFGVMLVLLNVGFPTQLSTGSFRPLTTYYVTFSLLYATYVFVLAALHKVAGSRYLAVAAMALNVTALKQNMNIYFGVPIYGLPPVEPFLVLLMLALLMSLRFSNAFHKIEELSGQLLQADKLKDDFLARTSHEFKTPLHVVMNISRSMLNDAAQPPTAEQREKLQLMTDITRRLSQLVYDILDLSKLRQGELRIAPAPIDVRSVAEMQVRFYSYLAAERHIQLVNLVSAHLPSVLADENRLSQVIGNLLDNAIKHTENGSIIVTGTERGGKLEIAVQDSGRGIEPQDLALIFEPFKSLGGAQRNGFGLGLSIARQLVELQQGTLTASSIPGVGSTFTITLPAVDQSSEAALPPPNTEVSPKPMEYSFVTPYYANRDGKHTVLIADDQYENLRVLIDALQVLDYRVIAVRNGYEALEQIQQAGKIDLAILDLMMPGMSGYEVCQEIRERYSLLELPVLMVTAAIQPQDKVAAFQAGANDYLAKPFDLEELKARIGSLLAMKESLSRAVHLEVAFLQSQIKPHFLFNVLNSIIASSYTDVERARNMIVDLADYLRGSFRFSNTEARIAFTEEFHLIQTYVSIEQARFKDRIRFEFDIAEPAFDLRIPPLLLQPLVENAIRHGIGDRLEGGTVTLTANESEGQWRFVVADDGVGIAPERLKTLLERAGTDEPRGVGLLNINKRLTYEYGVSLELESEPGHGTKVTVRIPDSPL
ncbi:ATP-binding protein [Paenibacillus medicaginis]|uniref:histidine kinase n=1 Tax=Paenibacillus medicaginis TaxID=1470560 RepID=A0ABV5C7V3_9BACL